MSGSGGGGGGAGAAVRQGHLRKLKTMKKKFFVLREECGECGARLEYYESEKKFRAGAAPRRSLPLSACYNITRRLDLKQKHVIALFTREEQFCIVAENEPDLHAWLSALLKQHHSDDASDELLHPIQHVWQVNVQKKGLGAVKNIHGLYNLCLTDKTLSLVKIKSHNNVISELGIPERVEYSLKNIRRCGDSECFFYMEVGRQTTTGAGELWMHSDDSNIAQSMHSTIYHAMRNCAKESENERDHIVIPKNEGAPPARRQTYSDARGRAGLGTEKGLCVGACIRQCVCAASGEDSAAALAPLAAHTHADYNPVLELPAAEVVAGEEPPRRVPAARRASTGARLCKLSPAHSKNAGTLRNRCDSMPSRACSSFDIERPPPRHNDIDGLEASRDETDAGGEWYRTPRIPEEPDVCDIAKDLINSMSIRATGSVQHSRTSSMGAEEGEAEGYLAMAPRDPPGGYLPMAPGHDPLGGLVSASSGSVCSGTPSTDPRFSEYQLEPATSHITEQRPPRAYSVGSRPAPRAEGRHRAYSVGARARPAAPSHAPTRARASHEDLMLLDFSNNSPNLKPSTPLPRAAPSTPSREEYVAMSPCAGYVEMRPGDPAGPPGPPAPDGYVEMTYGRTRPIAIAAPRPMPPPQPTHSDSDDRFRRKLEKSTPHGSQIFEFSGSLESPLSPASAPELDDEHRPLATVREASEGDRGETACVEAAARAAVSCSPSYVTLKPGAGAGPGEGPGDPCDPARGLVRGDSDENKGEWIGGAPVVVAGAAPAAGPARFAVPAAGAPGGAVGAPGGAAGPPSPAPAPLNYAALDLEPRRAPAHPAKRTYTQIDFVRSEKLHAADATYN